MYIKVSSLGRAACALLIVSAATPSHALGQFGGLVNRAKQKIAEKGVDKAAEATAPEAPGEKLTATTFNQLLAGFRATNAVLAARDAARDQRDADQRALNTLLSSNDGTRNAYAKASQATSACRQPVFNARIRERDAQMKAKMTADPQNVARMQMIAMKYGKAITDAQQRGDTAALAKAQLDMQREILGSDAYTMARADTAAADAKCGKLPAKPAALEREDELRAKLNKDDDSIRGFESQAIDAGAKASGMDKVRYLELKERVETILARLNGAGTQFKYGDEETALVRDHQAEIRELSHAPKAMMTRRS